MASTKTVRPAYACAECGWTTTKWVGRCGECQAWGTVAEAGAPRTGRTVAGPVSQPARPMTEISVDATRATSPGWASSTACSAAASCRAG